MDKGLIFTVYVNGDDSQQLTLWSHFNSPLLEFDYKLMTTETVKLISQMSVDWFFTNVQNHLKKIAKSLEDRLFKTLKSYEELFTKTNKFLNFLSSDRLPTQSYYVGAEVDSRDVGDLLFLLGEYKKSY